VDRILFGDNQFFGVNHMSEEKARQQAMRFQDLDEIMRVLEAARDLGAGGFMCTTHDRISDVLDRIRQDPSRWEGFNMYPGMPYAHKYANAVTELGYFDALRKFLPKDGLVDTMLRGGKALATQDMSGDDVTKLIRLNLGEKGTAAERIGTAGIVLTPGDKPSIASVRPGSEAARQKLRPGDTIEGVEVATERPSPFLFAIPAIVALGALAWLQRRRRGTLPAAA